MKNIKYLFLFLVIFLFCGCSVKYDLNIDDDLSVTEQVEAIEKEKEVKTNTGMNSDKAVDYLYDIFSRDGIEPSISSRIEGDKLIATVSASHKSIEDYVYNFSSDIFEEVILSKSGSLYSLTFKQDKKLSDKDSTAPIYDDVVINITVPFRVTSNNADKSYKDTYTWYLKKGEELRNIKIKFDTSQNGNTRSFKIGAFKINVKHNVLVFSTIIIIILTIVTVVYINNKKNNRF